MHKTCTTDLHSYYTCSTQALLTCRSELLFSVCVRAIDHRAVHELRPLVHLFSYTCSRTPAFNIGKKKLNANASICLKGL